MEDTEKQLQLVKNNITNYPDFPKPGIIFSDIFSVLKNPSAFKALQDLLLDHVRNVKPRIQCVVALESRGFLFGPILALQLGVPFVPIRKKGKLPGTVNQVTFTLEYGTDIFEIQSESIEKEQKVLIIDDFLATGGSLTAACKLVNQLGAQVIECLVVIELEELEGRKKIPAPVYSLIKATGKSMILKTEEGLRVQGLSIEGELTLATHYATLHIHNYTLCNCWKGLILERPNNISG